jgi:choline dehydrogenase-like flavoprotein
MTHTHCSMLCRLCLRASPTGAPLPSPCQQNFHHSSHPHCTLFQSPAHNQHTAWHANSTTPPTPVAPSLPPSLPPGKGEPDLQIRFVAGCSLDPDGVSAYAKFGELKKQGLNWPPGITFQLLNVRPKSKGSIGEWRSWAFRRASSRLDSLVRPWGLWMDVVRCGARPSGRLLGTAAGCRLPLELLLRAPCKCTCCRCRNGSSMPMGSHSPTASVQLLTSLPLPPCPPGLRSSDPFSMPAININYLTDKEGADMATLKAGIQMSREMTSGAAFAKYVEAEYFPGAAFNTDVAVEDYIRKSVHSGNAVVGTCRCARAGCAALAQ